MKGLTSTIYIRDIVKLRDYTGLIPRLEYYTWSNLENRFVKENTYRYPFFWKENSIRCSHYLIIYKQSENLKEWQEKISDIRLDWYYNLGDEERWGDGMRSICLNGQWGAVEGKTGKLYIPFGKYDFIDGFSYGISRVKMRAHHYLDKEKRQYNREEKWGIVNKFDEIVLPIEYDAVYSFFNKGFKNVYIIKDGVKKEFPLWLSSNELRPYYNDYDDDGPHRDLEYLRAKITGYRKPICQRYSSPVRKNYMIKFIGINDDEDIVF